jgi:6-phosphogluconolactonase
MSELAGRVAEAVRAAVLGAIAARGHANLVFSGGSTPEAFLPAVALLDLPWERVNVLLADERWVDESSADSNTAMLRRCLLSAPGPSRARYVALKNGALTAALGVAEARAALPPPGEPYDLVLLGMGNDGHFASIFPGNPRLAALLAPDNDERVAAVPAPTSAQPAVERITLTLAELKRSKRMVLAIQGQAKLDRLQAANDAMATPVAALGDVEVFWSP